MRVLSEAVLVIVIEDMPFPSSEDFKRFFKRLPWWVLPLILVLLFGRFVIVALFHWWRG